MLWWLLVVAARITGGRTIWRNMSGFDCWCQTGALSVVASVSEIEMRYGFNGGSGMAWRVHGGFTEVDVFEVWRLRDNDGEGLAFVMMGVVIGRDDGWGDLGIDCVVRESESEREMREWFFEFVMSAPLWWIGEGYLTCQRETLSEWAFMMRETWGLLMSEVKTRVTWEFVVWEREEGHVSHCYWILKIHQICSFLSVSLRNIFMNKSKLSFLPFFSLYFKN